MSGDALRRPNNVQLEGVFLLPGELPCYHAAMLARSILLLAVLLAPSAVRAADPDRDPLESTRPFDFATVNIGGSLDVGIGQDTSFNFGSMVGVFLLPGLELGLEVDLTTGNERPFMVSLLPYLRFVAWRSFVVSPFITVQGGRRFITDGQLDESAIGGGGGLIIFGTRRLGIEFHGYVYRLFPDSTCEPHGCITAQFGIAVSYYAGGIPPRIEDY
jgi:hypothetical protein